MNPCPHNIFNIIEFYLTLDDKTITLSASDEEYYQFKNNPRTTMVAKQRCVACRVIELKTHVNHVIKQ